MPHSNKSMLTMIRRMSDDRLAEYIAGQEEIDRRCKNPLPANKTLHDRYTAWAREELARRQAIATR